MVGSVLGVAGGSTPPATAPEAVAANTGEFAAAAEANRDSNSAIDLGFAYGAPRGQVLLDPQRIDLLLLTQRSLLRHERFEPARMRPAEANAVFTPAITDPLLGLEPSQESYFTWRDAYTRPGSADARAASVLSAFVRALHAQATAIELLDGEFPGGSAAFLALLEKDESAAAMTSQERGLIDDWTTRPSLLEGAARVAELQMLADAVRLDLEEATRLREVRERTSMPVRAGSDRSPEALAQDHRTLAQTPAPRRLSQVLQHEASLAGLRMPATEVEVRHDLASAVSDYALALAYPLSEDDRAALEDYRSQISPSVETLLATIIGTAARAETLSAQAIRDLTPEDAQALGTLLQKLESGQTPLDSEWLAIEGKVDLGPLQVAALAMAEAVETAAADYRTGQQAGGGTPALALPVNPPNPSLARLLVLGSPEAETFKDDAGLVIDLGGDDLYTAKVGGAWLPPSLSVCVVTCLFVPSANSVTASNNFVHAVVDLFGDDVYDPGTVQYYEGVLGGGNLGQLGMLFDFGGDDSYETKFAWGSAALGGGHNGVGAFIDYEGDDVYSVDVPQWNTPNAAFGSGFLGVGVFVDELGDDVYSSRSYVSFGAGSNGHGSFLDTLGDDAYQTRGSFGYTQYAYGAAQTGSGSFVDGAGDDEYDLSYAGTTAWGEALTGFGVMLDAGGFDSYSGGFDPPFDQTLTRRGTAGVSIDLGSEERVAHPLDVKVRIVEPKNRFQVAPGGTFDFVLRAMNLGTETAEDVEANLTLATREEDPGWQPGAGLQPIAAGPFPASFGDLAPGEAADRAVTWTVPTNGTDTTRWMEAMASLVSPDAEAANDVDFLDFTIEEVIDFRIEAVSVAASGRVTPDTEVDVVTTVTNRGNVYGAQLPVSLSITNAPGTAAYSFPATDYVDLPPRNPVYDPLAEPVRADLTSPWNTPTTQGNYTVKVSLPSTADYNVACGPGRDASVCQARTVNSQTVAVLRVVDARVSPAEFTPVTDPDFFEGIKFRVFNAGTDALSGRLNMTAQRVGSPDVFRDAVNIDLDPDESTVVQMKVPAPKPRYDEAWVFTAFAYVSDELAPTLADNRLDLAMTFRKGVIFMDDFEQALPNYSSKGECEDADDPIWRLGVPKYKGTLGSGLKAFSGTNVFGTVLTGPVCDSTSSDFTYKELDLTKLLAPVKLEFMSTIDSYGFPGSYALSGGYISVALAGDKTFVDLPVLPEYPCPTSYPYPFFEDYYKPMICGQELWRKYSLDLSEYAGQKVDLRFRYISYYCCVNSGRAGWMLDDLTLFGARRLPGDVEVVAVRTTPAPLLQGTPGAIQLEVRNNGLVPINMTGTVKVTLGTTKTSVSTPAASRHNLGPGQTGTVSIPFLPPAAKRYLIKTGQVEVTNMVDPRPENNQLTNVYLDVYAPAVVDTLESYACPPACGNWTHSADPFESTPDLWQLGTPVDFPSRAYSGSQAWATDLESDYLQGSAWPGYPYCCYGLARSYKLSSPVYTVPGANFVEGDEFALTFSHAYWLAKGDANENDIAYVVARPEEGSARVLVPDGGFKGKNVEGYCYPIDSEYDCGSPPLNPYALGWNGKSRGYELAVLPLEDAGPGRSYTFDFNLWSHFRSDFMDTPKPGWTLDDVNLVRSPRFDWDLAVLGLSPIVFNASSDNTAYVTVKNAGRKVYDPAEQPPAVLRFRVETGGAPIEFTLPVPRLEHGETQLLPFPFRAPHMFFGVGTAKVSVEWSLDEWAFNDGIPNREVRFGWLFYESDFERGRGGFEPTGNIPWRHGTRPDRQPLQGDHSWFAFPLAGDMAGALVGPKIDLQTGAGFRLKQVSFDGSVFFDGGYGKPLACNYNGFRLQDRISEQVYRMAPATFASITWRGISAHCGEFDPLEFTSDFTARQDSSPVIQPQIEAYSALYDWCTCYIDLNNRGIEVDRLAAYGMPYDKNVAILRFLSPGAIVGPGEEAKVVLRVVNGGLQWPDALGVQFTTNDAVGGRPSLSAVKQLARLDFAQTKDVPVTWRVPPSLEGQTVKLTARLVTQTAGGSWVPLADELGGDNVLEIVVSVVSIHDMAATTAAVPSLDPNAVLATLLRTTIENRGTLTEPGVQTSIRVLDEAGAVVYEVPEVSALTVAPSYAQAPKKYEVAWTPPHAGHYRLVAELRYPEEAEDVATADNVAESWIHAGTMPFRSADDFDRETTEWRAEGGFVGAHGFAPVISSGAPEGDHVLRSNPQAATYEPNASYRYEVMQDMRGLSAPRLALRHSYDLSSGDVARVLASEDQGATWRLLSPTGGYGTSSQGWTGVVNGWHEATFDLSSVRTDGYARFRLELAADSSKEGSGWKIDDVRILSGSTPVYRQGFESGLGQVQEAWDFEMGPDGWTSDASPESLDDWAVGTPTPTPAGAHSGTKAWDTNPGGSYSSASSGHKYLRSPTLSLPADQEEITFGWWQFYQIQFGQYPWDQTPQPHYSDAVVVRVSVDGGEPEVVTPETGYPMPTSLSSIGSERGFTQNSGGWEFRTLDLTAWAGRNVQVIFDFVVPYADSDWSRQYYVVGNKAGLTIDDAALYARSRPPPEVGSLNVRVDDVVVPIIGYYEEGHTFRVDLYNEATSARTVDLDWSWFGRGGQVLGEGTEIVSLEPGASSRSYTLPMVTESQFASLIVNIDAAGDDQPLDDQRTASALVYEILLPLETFETRPDGHSGSWPCREVSPCGAWTHKKWTSSSEQDEWNHGPVPAGKWPGEAFSGQYAFGTDLMTESPSDSDLSTRHNLDIYLQAPTIRVPDTGATLKFRHAVDTSPAFNFYYDGGQVYANGVLIHPVGGYPMAAYNGFGDCGYPLYSRCYWGQQDWKLAEFSLDDFRGQDVDLKFRYRSDPWYNPSGGWLIDDALVTGKPPAPQTDVAVSAPDRVRFDPRYPFVFTADVSNLGQQATSMLTLNADYFRDGKLVLSKSQPLLALRPGESRSVPLPLPPGSPQDVVVRLQVVSGSSPTARDDNPTNDGAQTRLDPYESLYANGFEDGRAPFQPSAVPMDEWFVVAAPPSDAPGAPSHNVLAAGLGRAKLSVQRSCGGQFPTYARGCNYFTLPAFTVPSEGRLDFDHFYRFSGWYDGAAVEYSSDGGIKWVLLHPEGGYPAASCGFSPAYPYAQPCFTGNSGQWRHVTVPLDGLAGKQVQIRFRYHTSSSTAATGGWALDNLVVRGGALTEALVEQPRFERGAIKNPNGPLEAVSFPGVWASGLAADSTREGGWDVLLGPSVDLTNIPRPRVSFDYWLKPESGAVVYAQALDAAGNWVELDRLQDEGDAWLHGEYSLEGLGDRTQIRFVYATPTGVAPYARPGFFVDDVLVGSLGAGLQRTDEQINKVYTAVDGQNLTVPVRVTNTGAFTNSYRLTARGPNPYWESASDPEAVTLQPGESRVVSVVIGIPYGGEPGTPPVSVLAQSLFDPLQRSALKVPIKLSVSPRPDWEIKNVGLLISTDSGDGAWVVQDAQDNHITVIVQNVGPKEATTQPRVVFYEHLLGGERRAFNTTYLEERDTEAVAIDVPYFLNATWKPRKNVEALEVVVNPGFEIPEMSALNNSIVKRMKVQPRPLPELVMASAPGFAKDPHADEPTTVGINVQNAGSAATDFAVDVAALAGYQDGLLRSPVVPLKGNDVLKLRYTGDLEPRVDGVLLEARSEGGPWVRLVPVGGYPYGCILALNDPGTGCLSGISGNTGDRARDLTFELKPLNGPTEFRLRFGMDSHNGRNYNGFLVHRVQVMHFRETLRDFNFAKGANGWIAEGGPSWAYKATDGAVQGAWAIARDYQNPFTIGLKQVPQGGQCPPCLTAGGLGFAEVEWTPDGARAQQMGGYIPLLVYLDPHDLQSEFTDDFNRFVYSVHVLSSGFSVTPESPIVLNNATADRKVGLVLRNAGNHDGAFEISLRESPHFVASVSRLGRPVSEVQLAAGQSLVVDLGLRGRGAPAGEHVLTLDALDKSTNKLFSSGIPVRVDSGVALPKLDDASTFTVRQKAMQTLLVQNPGNSFINVVLRATDKPAGLATRITPDEFTLAPFEARSVEFEFLNLGAKPGPYKVGLINAAVVCQALGTDCNRFADLQVTVQPYAPPTAAIRLDTNSVGLGQAVRFQDASTTTGSLLVSWRWDFGDGTTSTETSPVHSYVRPGVYEARLRVVDAEGQASESSPVLVAVVNREPTTVARVSVPAVPVAGQPVNFTAIDSSDLDGGIQQVTWAFGDGTLGHGVNVTHTYRQAGTYKVTVAVEDGFGAVSVQVLEVVVAPDKAAAPAAVSKTAGAGTPGPSPVVLLAALAAVLAVASRFRRRTNP